MADTSKVFDTAFESRREPILSRWQFFRRMLAHGGAAGLLVVGGLSLGILGYHFVCGLTWVDSILNASMILGGMGPVDPLKTAPAKLFASGYALFCGVIFLAVAGILFTPVIHRLMHHFHLDGED